MLGSIKSHWRRATQARSSTGKPIHRQLAEVIDLRLASPAHLGMQEYYDLELYQSRFSREQRRQFAGWRLIRATGECNNDFWEVFNTDKLVFYLYAASLGLPVPDTLYSVTRLPRASGSIRNLTTSEDVRNALLRGDDYPLFVKPIFSAYGKGAFMLECLDAASGRVTLSDGAGRSIDEVTRECMSLVESPRFQGCLIQRVLRPHPTIEEMAGPRVSGIRVGVAWGNGRPEIYGAVFKINRGKSLTDNFEHGQSGNMLGHVDLDSGRVLRVVTKNGDRLVELDRHPVTGVDLHGFVIPQWIDVAKHCLSIASAIPELKLIGCDVAVTDRGPVLLEINSPGDFDLLQMASQTGVLASPSVRRLFR